MTFLYKVEICEFEEIKKMHKGLYLFGGLGVGKTFAAACIANALSKKRYRCIVTNFNRIMNSVWTREHRQDILDELNSYDLLVIDDLGTEVVNAFSVSRLFTCLNERALRKKSIIISTNLSLEELRDRYSDRIFSRLTGNFRFCRMTGPDIRMMQ